MSPLRQHMIAALQRRGKGERTQQTYVREVRLLAQFYRTSPDLISAQALQPYVLHRKNINRLSPSSMRICSSALRFFYHHVLERDWKTLDLIRAESEHRLPAILSLEEVRRLLHAATPLHNRVSCASRALSAPPHSGLASSNETSASIPCGTLRHNATPH